MNKQRKRVTWEATRDWDDSPSIKEVIQEVVDKPSALTNIVGSRPPGQCIYTYDAQPVNRLHMDTTTSPNLAVPLKRDKRGRFVGKEKA